MNKIEVKEEVRKFLDSHPWIYREIVIEYLEENRFYAALGRLYELIAAGQFFASGIVKAAEAYENACMFDKALELYRKGIEVYLPSHIDVYDEGTGGYV